MTRFTIRQTPEYDYCLGAGLLAEAHVIFRSHGLDEAVIITNETLRPLYGDALKERLKRGGVASAIIEVPEGERYKSLEAAELLYNGLLNLGARRGTCLAALGGGVIGDVTGFVAATFMRGLPLVQVPTTLLAMVDSSIGGKTGVDLPRGKNLVGAFHLPRFVLADTDVLASLPRVELACGMAEVVKAALVASPELFARIEEMKSLPDVLSWDGLELIVERAARIKAEIVAADPFEKGIRAVLNLGHTMGHALEAALDYRGLRHGEAVALGMLFALRLSRELGVLQDDFEGRLVSVLRVCELPTEMPVLPWERLEEPMRLDKKRLESGLRMVLPVRPGEVTVRDGIPPDAARAAYLKMVEGAR